MKQLVVIYLPYVLSAVTIYTMVLAGDKKRSAWVAGMAGNGLWLAWIWAGNTWGLLPLNFALWAVYARNYRNWGRDVEA